MRRPFISLASQLLVTLGVIFVAFVGVLVWTVASVRDEVDELLGGRLEELDDWSAAADRAVARQIDGDHRAMARLLALELAHDLARAPRLVELSDDLAREEIADLLPIVLGSDPGGVHLFDVRREGPVTRIGRGAALAPGDRPQEAFWSAADDHWEAGRWLADGSLWPIQPAGLVYQGRERNGRALVVVVEPLALAERLARRTQLPAGAELLDPEGRVLLALPVSGEERGAVELGTVTVPGTPWSLMLRGDLHTHAGPETVEELDLVGPLSAARNRVLVTVAAVFMLGLFGIAALLHFRLTVPAKRLREDIRIVTRGNLEHAIDIEHAAELGALAGQFSQLTAQLRATRDRLREYNRTLERGVEERTAELNRRNLELSRAYQEKERAYLELQTTQDQMLHQERMATLGQLLAGIAHEINNPVNFMVNAIRPLEDNVGKIQGVLRLLIEQYGDVLGPVEGQTGSGVPDLDRVMGDIQQSIQLIRTGADRTSNIVANLRTFSRARQEELTFVDLASCLDVTLSLLGHQTKGRIEVIREYEDVGEVECSQGEINQVFMNLLSNACQAIQGAGKLWVRLAGVDGGVRIQIQDSGSGIPPELLSRIFEPFYTTKEAGVGTGLGLAITNNIVTKHGGRIVVASVEGETTEFEIWLPLRQGGGSSAWGGLTTAPEVDPARW